MKVLFKKIEGLRRSGKIQIESEAQETIVQVWSEIEVLNKLSDLGLKLLSFYSLTKIVFENS